MMFKFLLFLLSNLVLAIISNSLEVNGQRCTRRTTRREWRELSTTQQRRFTDAVIQLKQSGEFDDISNYHFSNSDNWHSNINFLPIHRYLCILFERALRRIDPSITLPYWDWSSDASDTMSSSIWDTFGRSSPGQCLRDGAFSQWRVTTPWPHCLVRAVNPGRRELSFAPHGILNQLIEGRPDFPDFAQTLEFGPHAQAHFSVGGDFAVMYSTNDPLFYLHHAYVDKIFYDWQRANPGSRYPGNLNTRLPAMDTTVGDVWELDNLCYDYSQPNLLISSGRNGRSLLQSRAMVETFKDKLYPMVLPERFLADMMYPVDGVRKVERELRQEYTKLLSLDPSQF